MFAFDDGDTGCQAVLAGAGIGCAPRCLAAQVLRQARTAEVLRNLRDAPVACPSFAAAHLTPLRVDASILPA